MLGVDAPEVILVPLPSSPSSQRHTPFPYSVRISASQHKRTPTRRSHGSKSTSSADDSNASLSSATNTGGSSRFRSSRITVGGRAVARRVICLLRWYVRDGASCIRPRARSTAGGDNLRSSKRRPKRSMCLFYVLLSRARYLTVVRTLSIKGGEEGYVACRNEHRDACRVQETASCFTGGDGRRRARSGIGGR